MQRFDGLLTDFRLQSFDRYCIYRTTALVMSRSVSIIKDLTLTVIPVATRMLYL